MVGFYRRQSEQGVRSGSTGVSFRRVLDRVLHASVRGGCYVGFYRRQSEEGVRSGFTGVGQRRVLGRVL